MRYNVLHFFERKNIDISNILYLTRQNPLTKITFFDGKEILTAIPVKDIAIYLPDEEFVNITKGILLRKSQIVNISDDGLYAMTDGSVFQGRKRNISQHKQLRQALGLSKEQNEKAEKMIPLELLEKCSILNDMPLAFCVIELVFDVNGSGVDFVFRYCNEEMAVVEGIPVSEMLNNSFYKVFENGDKKWLVTYADVALNGTKVILHDYSPEIGKELTIYCFQPHPGYCACILIPG